MKAIIAPLHQELGTLRAQLDADTSVFLHPGRIWHGRIGSHEICLARAGLGPRAMAETTRVCCQMFSPGAILLLGFGGATVPALHQGDVVLATAVVDAIGGATHATDPALLEQARQAGAAAGVTTKEGAIVTTDRVASPHEKAFLGTQHSAVVVDMEGAHFARAADSAHTPWFIARAVVDAMDVSLPDDLFPFHDDGTLSPWQLCHYFATHPRALPRASALHFATTRARDALTQFAKAWLGAVS